jgi:fatty-acyl-CoA synthase
VTDSPLVARARQHALGDLPRRTALRVPGKTAVVDGDVRLTFAEFDTAVGRLAAALAARGVGKGDRLAVLSHNCWQYGALAFATARLGVVLVPINFMLGPDEIGFILDHSGTTAIVAEDALAEVADKAIAQSGVTPAVRATIMLGTPPGTQLGWEDVDAWLAEAGTPPDVPVADDDPLRLMYTSGTESRPKGVLLSSRSLLWEYVSSVVAGGMSADDVDLHSLPLYHCAQLDCFFGPDVYLGATSIIARGPDPEVLLRTMAAERVTKFFAPPTVWIALLRSPSFDTTDLSSLRKGYYGASAMPVEILREIQRRLPDVALWNFYGQTEMSPVATILPPDEQLTHAGSAGRPVLNVETRVVDDDDRPVPQGEIGEIVHRSPHATLGYYRDEAKTAEAFRNGWFHSGDLGVFDAEGRLSVVDRKKDMIKTGGENVASREVEEVIYALDAVAEVAVFALDHPHWVEAVTAVVVLRAGAEVTAEAIRDHCRSRLAGYKTPKYVVFANALPKNPSGKILKRALRETYAGIVEQP